MDTTVVTTEEIEVTERLQLRQAEFKGGYQKAGEALEDIKVNKLYRFAYSSFNDYCQECLGFGDKRGYQIIEAAQVYNKLSKYLEKNELPANASQASELGKLDETEQQVAAWQTAQEDTGKSQPPAKAVKKAAEKILGFPKQAQVDKGKNTKQSVSTSGGSWGAGPSIDADMNQDGYDDVNQTGAGIDAEFERGGEQSPGAAGYTLEELQTLLAEYDNGDKCPYCGK